METNHLTEPNVPDQSEKSVSRSTHAVAKPKTKKAIAPPGNSDGGRRARSATLRTRKVTRWEVGLPILRQR